MKLIAIDLDGTLLHSDHKISRENAEAIKFAQNLGIEVSICTGRYYADAKALIDEAGIKTHIISNNGASVCSKDGEFLETFELDSSALKDAVDWLERNDYFYEIENDFNNMYLDTAFDTLKDDFYRAKDKYNYSDDLHLNIVGALQSQANKLVLSSAEEILSVEDKPLNLQVVTFDQDKRQKAMDYCNSKPEFATFASTDYNFEVTQSITSKGHALKCLASHLNVSLDETMAIGDSFNDLSMLKVAHYSIAMGNAREEIKKLCSFTTLKNTENGVAHAIHTYIKKLNLYV